jgi:hypothetical protein
MGAWATAAPAEQDYASFDGPWLAVSDERSSVRRTRSIRRWLEGFLPK